MLNFRNRYIENKFSDKKNLEFFNRIGHKRTLFIVDLHEYPVTKDRQLRVAVPSRSA